MTHRNEHRRSVFCFALIVFVLGAAVFAGRADDACAGDYQIYGKVNERYHLRYYNPPEPGTTFNHQPELMALIGFHADLSEDVLLRLELSSAAANQPATFFRPMGSVFDQPTASFGVYYLQARYWKVFETRIGRGPVTYVGDEILFSRMLTLPGIKQAVAFENLGPFAKVEVRGGADVVDLNVSPKSVLYGVQTIVETEAVPLFNMLGAFGYYNLTSASKAAAEAPARVNMIPNTNDPASDFAILQWHGEVGVPMIPVKVFGDVIENTASGTGNRNQGFMVGFSFGHMAQARSVAVQYVYLNLDQNCAISYLNSELWRTDISGHELSLGYQILDNVGVTSRLLIGDRPGEGDLLELLTTLQVAF